MSIKERLERIEAAIRAKFADVNIEVAWQVFSQHAEFWVYVLDIGRYEEVQNWCRDIEKETIATQDPEIWLLTKTWTGPWLGGDTDAEIREAERLERQREDFRRRHNMVRTGA
jgi:hypothetical protein